MISQFFISNQQLGVTLASVPFFAASKRATSPLSKSATSGKPSLTRSSGVFPSWFFLFASAPCFMNKKLKNHNYISFVKTFEHRIFLMSQKNWILYKKVKNKNQVLWEKERVIRKTWSLKNYIIIKHENCWKIEL